VTGRSIEQIIKATRHLLLDFDGPVCSIFAGMGADTVARQLRDTLVTAGLPLSVEAFETVDPLEVFRLAASVSTDAALTASAAPDSLRDPRGPYGRAD
jgi:hypothetical protein